MQPKSRFVNAYSTEKRRDKRRAFEIAGRLDGHPITILDLSLGGVAAAVYDVFGAERPVLRKGQLAVLLLPGEDGEFAKSFDVEIVRAAGVDGQFGLRFLDLDDAQFRLVEAIVTKPHKFAAREV